MQPSKTIRYLAHDQIDKERWDFCIDAAHNGLIYATSIYLDHMSPRWEALVMGDYEFVMPLTLKKKWGLRYLYQPAFTPQLGIFGATPVTPELVTDFIEKVKRHFRFAEIFFNHYNYFGGFTSQHCNLVISLLPHFEELHRNFKKSLDKSLSRIKKFRLSYTVTNDYGKAIRLYRETHGPSMPHVRETEYNAFEKLCAIAQKKGQLIVRQVAGENGDLLSINLLLKDHRRIYNLISTTLPDGRTLEANHALLFDLIKEFAGQPLVLDLEGSDIPGIARFYQKFGAVDEPYYFLRFNHLPLLIRWLKPR